jgi:hypothetical protein
VMAKCYGIVSERTVDAIIQDIVDLEPEPNDCAEEDPVGGLCIKYSTLEMILRRHILGEE